MVSRKSEALPDSQGVRRPFPWFGEGTALSPLPPSIAPLTSANGGQRKQEADSRCQGLRPAVPHHAARTCKHMCVHVNIYTYIHIPPITATRGSGKRLPPRPWPEALQAGLCSIREPSAPHHNLPFHNLPFLASDDTGGEQEMGDQRPRMSLAHPPHQGSWVALLPAQLLTPWNAPLGPWHPLCPGEVWPSPYPWTWAEWMPRSLCQSLPACCLLASCPTGVCVATSLLVPFSGSGREWRKFCKGGQGLPACKCRREPRRRGRWTAEPPSKGSSSPASQGLQRRHRASRASGKAFNSTCGSGPTEHSQLRQGQGSHRPQCSPRWRVDSSANPSVEPRWSVGGGLLQSLHIPDKAPGAAA